MELKGESMFEISDFNENERVRFKNPPKEFFEAIGGIEGMKKLMYKFYDKIYESEISHFFPQEIEEFNKVKEKNAKFFIQICGGPKVYEEANGMDLNEYMIKVHDDFSITKKDRIEWLGIMKEALEEEAKYVDKELLKAFWDYLDNFSKLTINSFNQKEKFYKVLLDKNDPKEIAF